VQTIVSKQTAFIQKRPKNLSDLFREKNSNLTQFQSKTCLFPSNTSLFSKEILRIPSVLNIVHYPLSCLHVLTFLTDVYADAKSKEVKFPDCKSI